MERPAKIKPQQGWAIYSPKGELIWVTVGTSEILRTAAWDHCIDPLLSIKEGIAKMEALGYEAKEVTITVKEPEMSKKALDLEEVKHNGQVDALRQTLVASVCVARNHLQTLIDERPAFAFFNKHIEEARQSLRDAEAAYQELLKVQERKAANQFLTGKQVEGQKEYAKCDKVV